MPKKFFNAYYLYMLYVKKSEEEKTGRKHSLSDVATLAADSWNQMSSEERLPFQQKAKGDKLNMSEERYTTQGVSYTTLDKIENDKITKEMAMQERINQLLNHHSIPDGLSQCPIFFMSGNYFYKKAIKYAPAELAIVKFTFKDGILNRYHVFLNPGSIELGYAADAREHAERTHRLPLPPDALGEKRFGNLFKNISELLLDDNGRAFAGEKPMVFTYTGTDMGENENILILESFMNQFSNQDSPIDIFSITDLFITIKSKLAEVGRCDKIENLNIARMLLDRDPYEYRTDLSCEFHEQADVGKHCALSKVTRWAYLMADYICRPLGIDMISGKHVPVNTDMSLLQKSMSSLLLYSEESETVYSKKSEASSQVSRLYEVSSSNVSVSDHHSVYSAESLTDQEDNVPFAKDLHMPINNSKLNSIQENENQKNERPINTLRPSSNRNVTSRLRQLFQDENFNIEH